MEKNSPNFSMEEIMRLANTDAGRRLMAFLQSNHPQAVSRAATSAQEGNLEQAQQALAAFLRDPKAQALLRQLQEEQHG